MPGFYDSSRWDSCALLKTYRAVIQLRFPPDSSVALTLPRYSRVSKAKKA